MKNISNKKIKKDNGFTLIEVLVVVVILSIFSVLLVQSINISRKVYSSNKIKTEASAVANMEIEKIRSMNFDDIGTINGDPGGTIETEEIIDDFTISRSISWVAESNNRIKQVKIIVSSANLADSIRIVTEITPLEMSVEAGTTTSSSTTTTVAQTTTTTPASTTTTVAQTTTTTPASTTTTTQVLYPAPYNLVVVSDTILGNKRTVILQWQKPLNTTGIITYNVYRNNSVIITTSSEDLVLQYTNNNFNKFDTSAYTYFITAVYGGIESLRSNEVTTTPF